MNFFFKESHIGTYVRGFFIIENDNCQESGPYQMTFVKNFAFEAYVRNIAWHNILQSITSDWSVPASKEVLFATQHSSR